MAARRIAVRVREGAPPGLFWLGGFKSDMKGTKAQALDQWARDHGRAMTRLDYSGHGESEGDFIDGTIGRWLEESLAVFDACCRGPQVVIGSSMGGWIALLLARELARRIGAFTFDGLPSAATVCTWTSRRDASIPRSGGAVEVTRGGITTAMSGLRAAMVA